MHLPTTIWLPCSHTTDTSPDAPAVLPDWALDKIRAEFTRRSGDAPSPLWRLAIGDANPGMDARTPCTTEGTSGDGPHTAAGTPVILAELHPDTLPTAAPHSRYADDQHGAMDDGWPGFFHRAHHLLHTGGLLLLATRQRRDVGVLTDPLGLLVACAPTAGFRYLQHIVVVHGHAADDRIVPAPPDGSAPGLIHSDLLVLDSPGGQS
ncbi:hypothetical protein AB0I82_33725 [Streptomyces sp. NPDC050315]|uniref:hypothetical protein n=1 Tax=Streptomyces sp. NPDC050315 TaxID=3155039 RepID=UPI00342D9979